MAPPVSTSSGNSSYRGLCPLLQARELRRQEGMDPPIPANVLRTLDAAERDLRLLCFKYAALAAAVAQRSQPAPGETVEGDGGGGGSRGTDGAEGAGGGGEAEGGLSEDDLLGLLEQHVRFAYVFVGLAGHETAHLRHRAAPLTGDVKADVEKGTKTCQARHVSVPTNRNERTSFQPAQVPSTQLRCSLAALMASNLCCPNEQCNEHVDGLFPSANISALDVEPTVFSDVDAVAIGTRGLCPGYDQGCPLCGMGDPRPQLDRTIAL